MNDPERDPDEEEEEPVNLILWASLIGGVILAYLFGRFLLGFLVRGLKDILG